MVFQAAMETATHGRLPEVLDFSAIRIITAV